MAADKNIDIWIYDNAGVLTLAYTEWSNAILRATALTRQDGVLVKTGAPAYRYLGTVRTIAAGGATCDTKLKRLVWNFYHRIERSFLVTEATDSWTYATNNTWRSLNNSTSNRIEFLIGVDESLVKFSAYVLAENSGNNGIAIGICLDNTNANNANLTRGMKGLTNPENTQWYSADYFDRPGIGYHFLQIVELSGGGTTTFYGDKGASYEVVSGGVGAICL